MKHLILLVKTGLLEQLKWKELKNTKDTKRKINTVVTLLAFLFLGLILVLYAAGGAFGMVFMGMGELIPMTAVSVVGIMTLMFTILKTNGILFGYKDYEMLASLPIKTSILVSSRFLQLYGTNLAISILIMLPMGIVYGIMLRQNILFYIMWIVGILIAPLIPTTIAAIIGSLIMALSARMKHANAFGAAISIIAVAAILVFSMSFGSMDSSRITWEVSGIMDMAKQSFGKIYPVSLLFYQAIVHKSILSYLAFVLGSCLWYAAFLAVISWKYKHIQSLLTAHSTRGKNTKAYHFEPRKKSSALLAKEWKRFLNSNIYLLNMGMGVVMLLLLTAAVAFFPQQKIMEFFSSGDMKLSAVNFSAILRYLPFLLAGVSSMSCTTACSLSLEGGNIEMLKALPLKAQEVYNGKIAMNLTFLLPATLISSLVVGIRYGTDINSVLLLFLIPVLFNVFNAVFGMYMNICMPNFSWENETIVVKQSMPSFIGIFGGIILAFLGGGITAMAPDSYKTAAMYAIAAGVALISLLVYYKVKRSPLP